MKVLAARMAKPQKLDITDLVNEFYEDVVAFCRRRVGEDQAADVTQETFLVAQRSLGKFRGQSSPRTWLLGIAHNLCRETCRKLGKDRILAAEIPDVGTTDPDLVDRIVLEEAMGRLSEDHREVVILHELEGLTYEEIARVLNAPVGTIKSRLHHAFVHLRRNLGVSVPA